MTSSSAGDRTIFTLSQAAEVIKTGQLAVFINLAQSHRMAVWERSAEESEQFCTAEVRLH
jgi:hypothetical protein